LRIERNSDMEIKITSAMLVETIRMCDPMVNAKRKRTKDSMPAGSTAIRKRDDGHRPEDKRRKDDFLE
jgi:hypothetical protein